MTRVVRPVGFARHRSKSQRDSIIQPRVDAKRLPWEPGHQHASTLKGFESIRRNPHAPVMAQSLAKILLHVVFSTKERGPFLKDLALREELHRYLGGILTNLECQPLIIGGVEDHVHLLFAHSRTATVAEVVKELKRGSTVWLKTKAPVLPEFAWQNGYGVFSIGQSQVEDVRAYIAGQEEHHRKISFQEEFRRLLQRYEIAFDERYVWD